MKRDVAAITALALAVVFACFLVSCNGGGGRPSAPDTTLPTIVSSSPADGAAKVRVIDSLQVVVSESLDSGPVNSSTVTLKIPSEEGLYTVRGTASYDEATRMITFKPLQLLYNDMLNRLIITGVKDLAGNALADTKITVKTYRNPDIVMVGYTGGNVQSYHTWSFNANNNMTSSIDYTDADGDGTWFHLMVR
jgi:hypothetical protein